MRLASRGTHGAVAGGSEYATEAGMRMYYHGGNAVDAGVATMLAASVVEFSHFGLGGEAPILVRTKDGKVYAIAGVGTMPKLATAEFFRNHKLTDEEMTSPPEAGGTEGLGAGGGHPVGAGARHGGGRAGDAARVRHQVLRRSRAAGHRTGRRLSHRRNARQRDRQQREVSGGWPDCKRTFLPNGRPPQPGDIFRQPDLARTLRAMADAEKKALAGGASRAKAIDAVRDYFYRGEIAHRIDEFSKAHNGLLRYEDMAAFRVEPEEPVSTTFHGYTVYKPGFWSQGPSHDRGPEHSGRLRHPAA